MFRFVARNLKHSGGRRTSQGPTVTIKVDSGVAQSAESSASGNLAPRKERIVRPLTEEEENYELTRVRKNAGSNLRMKGKHAIQTNRKHMERKSVPSASYDQY
jgi:hypothetical protein